MEEQTPSRGHNYSVGEHELQHGKFQLDRKENTSTVVAQWNGSPREVVASPPPKTQSGEVLSNLVKLILLRVEPDDVQKFSSNLNYVVIL